MLQPGYCLQALQMYRKPLIVRVVVPSQIEVHSRHPSPSKGARNARCSKDEAMHQANCDVKEKPKRSPSTLCTTLTLLSFSVAGIATALKQIGWQAAGSAVIAARGHR